MGLAHACKVTTGVEKKLHLLAEICLQIFLQNKLERLSGITNCQRQPIQAEHLMEHRSKGTFLALTRKC